MAKVAESTLIQLDAKRTTEEHAQAARDAEGAIIAQADAAVQLAEDQAKANGQTLSAEEKTRIYRDQLAFMSSDLTGPTKAAIDGHIAALGRIPAGISTQVTTRFGSLGSADYTQPGFGSIGRRASGGPVSAGGAYLVGEQGPELLQMGSSGGNVVPNNALGGGNTINVAINVNGGDPQQVVNALRQFVRRNGPIQGLT